MKRRKSKTEYLSYIEETKKHLGVIEEVAKESSLDAIDDSLNNGVPVTYMEGETIVQVQKSGEQKKLKDLKLRQRKVSIGETTTIQKG